MDEIAFQGIFAVFWMYSWFLAQKGGAYIGLRSGLTGIWNVVYVLYVVYMCYFIQQPRDARTMIFKYYLYRSRVQYTHPLFKGILE